MKLSSGLATIAPAVALVLTVVAYGPQQTGSSPERVAPEVKAVRVYVFDCGTLRADPARFRLKKEEVATTNLSVPCFLVAHPQGRLMWDPGAVPDADWTPTDAAVTHHLVLPDGSGRDLMLRKPLKTQLSEIGYSATDITHLAFSHYHYDHTANANAFAGATWLVRQVERDAMFAEKAPAITRPSSYDALKTSKTVIIDRDEYDVFGDGTVITEACGRTHAWASGALREATQDRRHRAVWRPLSFSRGPHAQTRDDVRLRSGANAGLERRHRGIPRENRRAAVDPTRLRWQRPAQEGS
jgi:glyoxylase-like metal-dependent hydrolase (beta-lactamase superfamily II)